MFVMKYNYNSQTLKGGDIGPHMWTRKPSSIANYFGYIPKSPKMMANEP